MIPFDFLSYFETFNSQFITPLFEYLPKTLVEYDPLKTVQEYLVYLGNSNNEIIDKLSYLIYVQEQSNVILNRLLFVLWLILLFLFIWFCLSVFKALVYMILDKLKI